MPHGGHQQICESKFLSMLPYYHLLPSFLYKLVLRSFGEAPSTIECLMEVKSTGISIERFEKACQKQQLFNRMQDPLFAEPYLPIQIWMETKGANEMA